MDARDLPPRLVDFHPGLHGEDQGTMLAELPAVMRGDHYDHRRPQRRLMVLLAMMLIAMASAVSASVI